MLNARLPRLTFAFAFCFFSPSSSSSSRNAFWAHSIEKGQMPKCSSTPLSNRRSLGERRGGSKFQSCITTATLLNIEYNDRMPVTNGVSVYQVQWNPMWADFFFFGSDFESHFVKL